MTYDKETQFEDALVTALTEHYGWEKQIGQDSVQEQIEKAIGKILNTEINIYASGRTDAGVHASGQTFHFDINEKKYEASELMYRINCVLPVDIKLTSLEYLDNEEFHSRYNAKSKEYQYRLSLSAKQPYVKSIGLVVDVNTIIIAIIKINLKMI